jgi:hypothetical protein
MTTMLCGCHKTYERVAEKGYKSICSKSWAYYFNGLEKTQWYGELFAMTTESNQLIIIAMRNLCVP